MACFVVRCCLLFVVLFWFVVVFVFVVEWLYYSGRITIVRWAGLSDVFVDFRRKMYFCFTSNENCHFSSEKT